MVNLSMTKEAVLHNDGNTISSTNAAGKTGELHGKNEIIFQHHTHTKKSSKWIKDLNMSRIL